MGKAFLDPGFELLVNNWRAFRSPFFITMLLRQKCPTPLQAQALSVCCHLHLFLVFQKTLHCTRKQRSSLFRNYWMQRLPQDSKPSVDNNTRYSLAKSIKEPTGVWGSNTKTLPHWLLQNNSKWRACSQANTICKTVNSYFYRHSQSLPSLTLCFQPRSRPLSRVLGCPKITDCTAV